jgi:transposase
MLERKQYASDLSDAEWEIIEPLLPEDKLVGRLRQVDLREVLNAIYYRADNGVKWRNLPGDFPAWQWGYGVVVMIRLMLRRLTGNRSSWNKKTA